ncbi:polysaccharide deacetylase family protein [Algoriphagus sp. Y33]|uniref:polysaccharide deacetylase family protein n=1 Tax=Algoriphagus sp. Y33 TaxID=2772483 RepID=UPI00177F222F|nr:polysaccharide deacetylase family protein [Algoriphagus sp. Y33]
MTKGFIVCSFFLMFRLQAQEVIDAFGARIRSDSAEKIIYLCFTGHDYYEGFDHVQKVLEEAHIKGSFFLTGDFVRKHKELVSQLAASGHYVGAHSDKHLLYCDWVKRDSLLVSVEEIKKDILDNVKELNALEIFPRIFLPPYEWYNRQVVQIASEVGQYTVNFSPGTRSNADYTTPQMKNYVASEEILASIYEYESSHGMNGFHLLIHPGTDPVRKDKFYFHMAGLIKELRQRGYGFDTFLNEFSDYRK